MTTQPQGPTRRTVLNLAVTVGAAGVVTACGGGSDSAEPAGSTSEGSSSAPAPSSAASSAAPGGDALVKTADVPVGGGVILDDAKVVVTQPTAGQFKAFSSRCTHMGCQLNNVTDGEIACVCHGSRFSIRDGTPDRGPATSPLQSVKVSVEGDSVVRA